MGDSKRLVWVDIAKGIAIALVIVGHTLLNGSISRKLIFSLHMPVFFILAGYAFKVKPMRKVLVSSAQRLLIPYFLIFLARNIIGWVHAETFDPNIVNSALLSFVFASGVQVVPWGIPAAGMIWFLMALFLARIIMNTVQGFFEKRNVPELAQLLFWLLIGFCGICLGEPAKTVPFSLYMLDTTSIMLPFSLDIVFVACFFMYVGYKGRMFGFDKLLDKWWTIIIAVALWALCCHFSYLELAARRYDFRPCALLGAIAGSYMIFWVSRLVEVRVGFLSRPIAWLGANSMLLFCIHAFDAYFAPWSTLPFVVDSVPYAIFLAGALRLLVDVMIAYIYRKV